MGFTEERATNYPLFCSVPLTDICLGSHVPLTLCPTPRRESAKWQVVGGKGCSGIVHQSQLILETELV